MCVFRKVHLLSVNHETAALCHFLNQVLPPASPLHPSRQTVQSQTLDLSKFPVDVLHHICCIAVGKGLHALSPRRMHARPGNIPSSFAALRLSCKLLRKVGDLAFDSVHLCSDDMEEAMPFIQNLNSLSLLSLNFHYTTQPSGFDSYMATMSTLHPKLTTMVIHGETVTPIRRTFSAHAERSLLPWQDSLQNLSLYNIYCVSSDKTSETRFLSHSGLMFLSQMTRLRTLNLQGTSPLGAGTISLCTGLVQLDVRGPHISESDSLDVSCCHHLESLKCFKSTLSVLVVSGLPVLKLLDCCNNKLSKLDLAGCTALKNLKCLGNNLTMLDVASNHALEVLECSANPITQLDLTGCGALKVLFCTQCNSVEGANISNCKDMETISSSFTDINAEQFQACPRLRIINMSDSTFASDLSLLNLKSLRHVDIVRNRIRYADFTGCTALTHLRFEGSPDLQSLKTSGCTFLKHLYVETSDLHDLDASHCRALELFKCSQCIFLKSLDFSMCLKLQQFYCEGSAITNLDVSEFAATLTHLSCMHSLVLQKLSLRGCDKLASLNCSNCFELEHLDCTGCSSLNPNVLNLVSAGKFQDMSLQQLRAVGA